MSTITSNDVWSIALNLKQLRELQDEFDEREAQYNQKKAGRDDDDGDSEDDEDNDNSEDEEDEEELENLKEELEELQGDLVDQRDSIVDAIGYLAEDLRSEENTAGRKVDDAIDHLNVALVELEWENYSAAESSLDDAMWELMRLEAETNVAEPDPLNPGGGP